MKLERRITEETGLKIAEASLVNKFAQILGVTPVEGEQEILSILTEGVILI